jgi:hypothetical protein
MRNWIPIIPVLAVVLVGYTTSAQSRDICFRLWVERNAIYKDHGYCFHSWRARSYFGNGRCAFAYDSEVPLSYGAAARIADIQEQEYAYGCRWAPPGY